MPRNSTGDYDLPSGNPVEPGEVIESNWANTTMDDIAEALSDSLDRYGRGGMLAPFKFADGTKQAPGATWTNESNTGLYRFDNGDLRMSVLATDTMRWQPNTAVQIWNSTDGVWEDILTGGIQGLVPVPEGSVANEMLRWDEPSNSWAVNSNARVDASGNLSLSGEIIATFFVGDGSKLTNLPSGIADGTTDGQILRWDEVGLQDWLPSNAIIIDDVGNVEIGGGDLTLSGGQYFGDGSQLTGLSGVLPDGNADGQYLRWDNDTTSWAASNAITSDDAGDVYIPSLSEGETVLAEEGTGKLYIGQARGATTQIITQVAHGFTQFQAIRWTGTEWGLAQANDEATTALGVVLAVVDVDQFYFCMSGRFTTPTPPTGLVADSWYYVSQDTPGLLTTVKPGVGIEQPILYAEGTDTLIVYPYRPSLSIESATTLPGTVTGQTLLWDTPTESWTPTDALTVIPTAPNNSLSIGAAGIVSGMVSDNSVSNPNSKMSVVTQAQYDGLTPDADTLYFIVG